MSYKTGRLCALCCREVPSDPRDWTVIQGLDGEGGYYDEFWCPECADRMPPIEEPDWAIRQMEETRAIYKAELLRRRAEKKRNPPQDPAGPDE